MDWSDAYGAATGYYELLMADPGDFITGDPGSITQHKPTYIGKVKFSTASLLPLYKYSITRVVLPAPCTISLTATQNKLCIGSSTTLIANGYNSAKGGLTWTVPGALPHIINPTGNSITVYATTPGTYTVSVAYTVSVSSVVCTASATVTVSSPPTLVVTNSTPLTVCANQPSPSTVTLTATCATCTSLIWTPSYGLSPATQSPMSSSSPFAITVAPEQNTTYIVYATDGVCWTSSSAPAITSNKPVINSITGPIVKCNDGSYVDLTVDAGTGVSYSWNPSGGTSATAILAPNLTTIYTVTVTTTGTTCTSTALASIKVNQHCCASSNAKDVLVYSASDPASISRRADLAAAINLVGTPRDYTMAGSVVTHANNTGGSILINGYFEVDNNITFNDCIIHFGEQAEVHVNTGSILTFHGCNVSSCNGYTWRSIYAEEGATVIVEDNSGTPTQIWDADTALNLKNDAEYNIVNSEFTNNYTAIYLYNYNKAVNQGIMGNIFGNTFSSSLLNTSPVGTYSFGLSGISLKDCQNITIGSSTDNANNFNHLYLGINSLKSDMEIFNNDFTDIQYSPYPGFFAGSGIYSESTSDGYDRTVKIGNGYPSGRNNFDNSADGVVTIGEQNVTIDNNYFGNTTRLTRWGTYLNGVGKKKIQIMNNKYWDFHIATYLQDIDEGASVTINENVYNTADLSLVGSTYYGTAIALDNTTQTDNNVSIYDNDITDARIGIAMKKVNKAKIYKVATGNAIKFHLGTGSLSHSYYAISLDHCDDVFVHENSVDNSTYANSSTNFRGLNVVASTGGNICSNTISDLCYSMYFEGNCVNTVLKLCTLTVYEKAIFFNNAFFSQQGINNTETWENVFDDNLTNERLDGTFDISAGPIDWHYNSNNTDMHVNGGYNGVS